jgi:L-iditol 2-dehydrogenase
MVGRIVHVGAEVSGFSVGERITLATTIACGSCPFCALGRGNICPNAKPISFDYDGALAEYVGIPPEAVVRGNVIKVPETADDMAAALSEPLSCALNAQELAGVKRGDVVLILGGGPLSALHAELAKARGAAEVLIVGRSEPRLSLMRKLKDVTVVDGRQGYEDLLRDKTAGLGADHVVVCAPVKEVHELALKLVRKGGCVLLFASLPKADAAISFDSRLIHYGEIRVIGSSDSRPEHVERAVQLLSEGRIDTGSIITHILPLSDFGQGIELMKRRQSLKVLLRPGGDGSP